MWGSGVKAVGLILGHMSSGQARYRQPLSCTNDFIYVSFFSLRECVCGPGFTEVSWGTCLQDGTGISYLALLKNRWLEIPAAGVTLAGVHANFGYFFADDTQVSFRGCLN